MCNKLRSAENEIRAGMQLELVTELGVPRRGKWAGSATFGKLTRYWLGRRFPGNELVQWPHDLTEVSETDKVTGQTIWAPAPPDTRAFFVLEAPPLGRDYRLAKLVTIKATPDELMYFNASNESVPFTGRWEGGNLIRIPLPPVPSRRNDLLL